MTQIARSMMVKERINWSDPDVVTFPDISVLTVEASVTSSTFSIVEVTSFAVEVSEVSRIVMVGGEGVVGLLVPDPVSCGSETLVVLLID